MTLEVRLLREIMRMRLLKAKAKHKEMNDKDGTDKNALFWSGEISAFTDLLSLIDEPCSEET